MMVIAIGYGPHLFDAWPCHQHHPARDQSVSLATAVDVLVAEVTADQPEAHGGDHGDCQQQQD